MNNNRSYDTVKVSERKRNFPILATDSRASKCDWIKELVICFFLSIFIALQILIPYYYLHASFDYPLWASFVSIIVLAREHFDLYADNLGYRMVYATSAAYESPSPNHPPTAYSGVSYTTRDTPVLITLRATDQDGDPLTFFPSLLSTKTAHGKLGSLTDYSTSSAITTARITYSPDHGYVGTDSFAYQAADISNAAGNIAIINIIIN